MNFLKTVILLLLINNVAMAQKMSIQDRLSKLEQQSGGSQNTAELVFQIQQMQTQVAELQGVIEEQNHQINELQKRQKVLYVDMDSRIARLEESPLVDKSQNELTVDSAAGDTIPSQNSSNNTNSDNGPALGPVTQNNTPQVRENITADVSTSVLNQPDVNASSNAQNPQAQGLYESAFNQLKAGRFGESARLFEDFIQQYPNHDLTDNSYYWLGESYYVNRNYPMALSAFQSLEQKFPLSSKLADSLLKIGYTYHELEDYQQAKEALLKVTENFSNSSVSRLAENRLNLLRREGKIN